MSEPLAEEGRRAYDRGEYETAIAAFSATRDWARSMQDPRGEASALMDMGVAHQRMGNLADAQASYEEALILYEQFGDDTGKAKTLGNLAMLMKRRGAADQAESLLQQAADLFYTLGKEEYEADTLKVLTQVQLQRAKWMDALISYNRALACLPQHTMRQKLILSMTGMVMKILGIQLPVRPVS
jgi:tetratricopeptide (TPR) repeat protein